MRYDEPRSGMDPAAAADRLAVLTAELHDLRDTLSATRHALAETVAENRRLREQLATLDPRCETRTGNR